MCSKSGKFSAEIEIQCRKLNLKMFPVRTDYVDGQIGSAIPHRLLQMREINYIVIILYKNLNVGKLYFQWMRAENP